MELIFEIEDIKLGDLTGTLQIAVDAEISTYTESRNYWGTACKQEFTELEYVFISACFYVNGLEKELTELETENLVSIHDEALDYYGRVA